MLDFGQLDAATAKRLLAEYGPVVHAMCRLYPSHLRDDLSAVGRVAVLEAYLSHEPSRSAQATWVRRLVRWRLAAEARAQGPASLPLTQEPAAAVNEPAETTTLPAFLALSPLQREIVLCRLNTSETFEQLAARLHTSRQRICRQYHAALQQLQAT
jgi:DNA-directed RNA polymerase specialized sigma subunit